MTQCSGCGQLLTEIDFNGHHVSICTNWECPLYRRPQVTRVKIIAKETKSRTHRPSYKKWLKQRRPKRRERYKAIRGLGIDSKQAIRFRDMTSMTIEDVEELARRTREIVNLKN